MDFKTFEKLVKTHFKENNKQVPKRTKVRHWHELYLRGHDYDFIK